MSKSSYMEGQERARRNTIRATTIADDLCKSHKDNSDKMRGYNEEKKRMALERARAKERKSR